MQTDNDFARNLVSNRSKRTSATILTWLENNVYHYVPDHLHSQIRTKILDSVNDLADLSMDIVKSDVSQINEFWVKELADIKNMLRHG